MEAATHPVGSNIVQSYGHAGFKVSGTQYAVPILLTERTIVEWKDPALTIASLDTLFDVIPGIEVLIVGTGASHVPLPSELREAAKKRGVSIDGMATGAACRTYNILISEDRRVGAAIMLP